MLSARSAWPEFSRSEGKVGNGGRYWVRTSDLFGVNEARYHCANRPQTRSAWTTLSHLVPTQVRRDSTCGYCCRLEAMCHNRGARGTAIPKPWVCPADLISIELKRSYVYPYSRRRPRPTSELGRNRTCP